MEVCAWLVPEPENPHDPLAVKVVIAEQKVGYLPADRAALWQPILVALTSHYRCYVACPAVITGGGRASDGSVRFLGVVLFVPVYLDPERIAGMKRAEGAAQREAERQARREALSKRFDEHTAMMIMIGDPWEGATREMICEACGYPDEVEERVMKSKTRHVLKYRAESGRKIRLRVVLEDGIVVGWESKDA